MAKPNQPKDIKPKAEGEEGASEASPKGGGIKIDENMKMIIINLATTVLICILFLSVNYILQANLLNSKLAQKTSATEETAAEGEEGAGDEVQRGIIVDLGDFILNLSDVSPRKYLKVNVALEVSKSPQDMELEAESAKGGGHGEGAAAVNPVEAEMAQFKPSMRDAIITTLSSKTSAELSTVAGKELAKEQIAEAVNGIFSGEREVIRVSFGQFIIQ
ncbi:MAG TPA: flagellar basal body-associated FliL family protein [Candidatus Gastranaerophilaceae bacterium]|nr:flagellar basal body-associated FliL family protein [Candidatus Gastranaerophilaceae bacterium]HPT41404.1 flagellar basal body-associated FliL family protein [Candidatus Gastranaerophilaceae bacterium]